MGGEREVEVEKSKSEVKVAKEKGSGKANVGNFRIHQSGGEIHVHDDKDKLKAAVPASAWWKMWDKLRNEPGVWTWIDHHFKTKLVVETALDGDVMDVKISLTGGVTVSDSWDKINNFTKK